MSSSSDEEDEAPPPLEDVSQELSKLGVKDASYEAKSSDKGGKAKSDAGAAQKKGLRRGFFDAPRKRTKPKGNASQKPDREGLVEIKAKKSGPGGSGPESKVPDWMKIDPNSDQAKLMQMKDKVSTRRNERWSKRIWTRASWDPRRSPRAAVPKSRTHARSLTHTHPLPFLRWLITWQTN